MIKKRYYEIDLARSICILFLPLIHIYEYWGTWGGMADILQDSVSKSLSGFECFLTVFVAQSFMVCMGMNMVWTGNNTAKAFAKRGAGLLLIEIMLNLIRYVMPGLIGVAIGGTDTPQAATALKWMVYGFINSDILAFAGLAFLVFAIFRLLNLKPRTIMIFSILCLVLNSVIFHLIGAALNNSCSLYFNEFLGNFFYVNADSTFSLLGWLIFPACGYLMASCLMGKDADRQRRAWIIGGAVSAVWLAAVSVYFISQGLNPILKLNPAECGRRMDFWCVSGDLAAAILFICVCHGLYALLHLEKRQAFNDFVRSYSAGITTNYMIQWTIVGWVLFITCGTGLWGCKALNMAETLTCFVLIEAVSYLGSRWWMKHRKKI